VVLFDTLAHAPKAWPQQLLRVVVTRGPGIAWIGQFFVPLSHWTRSVDVALLVSILLIQLAGLLLIFCAVHRLYQRLDIAALGVFAVGGAPLFVDLGHLYMTESLQLLSVTWFVWILASSQRWNRVLLLGQLFAATMFALMTRESTPFSCLVLGLAALASLVKSRATWGWSEKRAWLIWLAACLLAVGMGLWYRANLKSVVAHVYSSATDPAWGGKSAFPTALIFWLKTTGRRLFTPGLALFSLGGALVGALYYTSRRSAERRRFDHSAICALSALLQIVTTLSLFALGSNRSDRYLLPLLPCFVILISWGLVELKRPWASGLVLSAFVLQLAAVHGESLGLFDANASVRPVNRSLAHARIVDELVARTCIGVAPSLSIIAIDLDLMGDWLGPTPATYAEAKRFGRQQPCQYGYIGSGFFGENLDRTLKDLLIQRPRFVVTTDPYAYPPRKESLNRSLTPENHFALLKMVDDLCPYEFDHALTSDRHILVFRHVECVRKGRALIDAGRLPEAVEVLRKAISLDASDFEAWANLALAFTRLNRPGDALMAAKEVLRLRPTHSWANRAVSDILHLRENLWR
jgi:hypothetical protein